jgi:aminopeptidase N
MLLQPLPTSTLSWADDPVSMEHIFSNLFLAHEIAHQWWGQAIGWKNYHEQWLSEGLAQYSAVLYAESERGPEVLARLISEMRKSAEDLTDQGPIYLGYRLGHLQMDGRIFRAIVYNKSAVVLHMLRRLVGDEVFFASLRDFYRSRRFRKAGTGDLREVFEARAKRSLERFIERWIHSAELPQLRFSTSVDNTARIGRVRVRQLGEIFDLPVPVQVQYQDGKTEEIQLIVGEADREHEIPLKAPARRIVVREELILMAR